MIDRKILVIEDDPDIQELVKYNLEKEGYEVSCSSTGEDGLKLAHGWA
jgi:two-component system alkaline phosphatase synthesis response regulator PhoP